MQALVWDLRADLRMMVHALIPAGGDENDVGDDAVMGIHPIFPHSFARPLKRLTLQLPQVRACTAVQYCACNS